MIVLDGDEFLTVEEAATRLGIKPASLYAYVSRGVIRSYRQGIKRQRLYRRAEVEALLRVAPAGGPAPASPAPSDRDRARRRRVPDIPLAESWIRE
jgi:citrate synthase